MSKQIIVIKNPLTANITHQPAKTAIGDSVPQQGVASDHYSAEMGVSVGVWESTPGLFTRNVKSKEFSHIISGWCIFIPIDGEPLELHAGDAVMFPENCQGIWDIRETLRKTYVIFEH